MDRRGVDSLLSRRINSVHQPHPAARRVRKARRRWGRSSGRATPSLRCVPIGAVHPDCRQSLTLIAAAHAAVSRDGAGERMVAQALDGNRHSQQILISDAGAGTTSVMRDLLTRQRAGLVEGDGREGTEILERPAALQHAAACRALHPTAPRSGLR